MTLNETGIISSLVISLVAGVVQFVFKMTKNYCAAEQSYICLYCISEFFTNSLLYVHILHECMHYHCFVNQQHCCCLRGHCLGGLLLFCIVILVPDCQERFDQELLQLKGRLQSLSDEQFESHTESHDRETLVENCVQDGALLDETRSEHTTNQLEELEASDKLQEILNRELLVFSEKVFCSKTGDVSKEHEMNQRHHHVDECSSDAEDGEDNSKPEALLTDGQSHQETSDIQTAEKLVYQQFQTEVDSLRRNLTEGLVPLILSTDGKLLCYFISLAALVLFIGPMN